MLIDVCLMIFLTVEITLKTQTKSQLFISPKISILCIALLFTSNIWATQKASLIDWQDWSADSFAKAKEQIN